MEGEQKQAGQGQRALCVLGGQVCTQPELGGMHPPCTGGPGVHVGQLVRTLEAVTGQRIHNRE